MGKVWIGVGVAALWGGACLVGLTACDGGSAARSQQAAGAQPVYASAAPAGGASEAGSANVAEREAPRTPVPLVNGKPMWAANRRHSAQENAEYQFNRDGPDFGARTVDEFVSKAHAFVDEPPAGVQTLTRRNGDRLLYDPKANVFAVVDKDGAPRTMFKPRDGGAYWEEQKARVAQQASGGYGRRSRSGDGGSSSDDQG